MDPARGRTVVGRSARMTTTPGSANNAAAQLLTIDAAAAITGLSRDTSHSGCLTNRVTHSCSSPSRRAQPLGQQGWRFTRVYLRQQRSVVREIAEEAFMGSTLWVLGRVLDVDHDEGGGSTIGLRSNDASHALHHLAPGAARSENDADVRIRDVDTFVEYARCGEGGHLPGFERIQQLLSLGARKFAGVVTGNQDASVQRLGGPFSRRRGLAEDEHLAAARERWRQ